MTIKNSEPSTMNKFMDEYDHLQRTVEQQRQQIAIADDQLRAASVELEKSANRVDFLVEQLNVTQAKADRWQRIAERALTKLETIGGIMINGIKEVLDEAKTVEWGDKPRVRVVDIPEDDGAAEMAARFAPRVTERAHSLLPGEDPRLPRPSFGSGPRRA